MHACRNIIFTNSSFLVLQTKQARLAKLLQFPTRIIVTQDEDNQSLHVQFVNKLQKIIITGL